jgi:hypothetical protein
LGFLLFCSLFSLFCFTRNFSFYFADGFFVIVVGTLGMMVPASGGIGAFILQ